MHPLTAPDRVITSALRVALAVVVGMNDVGNAPSSICGAAKAIVLPELVIAGLLTAPRGPMSIRSTVPLAVSVKVSEQR